MYIKDDSHATYKLLRTEFEKKGYTTIEQLVNDALYISFVSPEAKEWRFRAARIGYPFTSAFVKELSVKKEKAYDYAKELGISIPYTWYLQADEVIDRTTVSALIKKYNKLIVKPSNASLSRGLTLNIETEQELEDAIAYSRSFKDGVVVQEQVEGEEIRFIIVEGKVKAALLRQTARVIGDGTLTIAELIKIENETRASLVFPYIKYPQLTADIVAADFFTSTEVLAKGEVKELNRATMIKNGSSIYNVLSEVHPSHIKVVEKLVDGLDTQFLAADFFYKDYTQPMTESNYWFIEMNTSPVLKLCYGCRDGQMFDVIPYLVDVIDSWLHAKA